MLKKKNVPSGSLKHWILFGEVGIILYSKKRVGGFFERRKIAVPEWMLKFGVLRVETVRFIVRSGNAMISTFNETKSFLRVFLTSHINDVNSVWVISPARIPSITARTVSLRKLLQRIKEIERSASSSVMAQRLIHDGQQGQPEVGRLRCFVYSWKGLVSFMASVSRSITLGEEVIGIVVVRVEHLVDEILRVDEFRTHFGNDCLLMFRVNTNLDLLSIFLKAFTRDLIQKFPPAAESMNLASLAFNKIGDRSSKNYKIFSEINKKDFVEKEIYDKLFKSFTTLEKHYISLEVDTQLNQEILQRDNSVSNQSAPSFDQLFELNELKAQSQEKDTVIKKLKERIKSLSGKLNEDKIKKDLEEIETINIKLDHRVSKLIAENEHLKQTYKQLYDSIKPACIQSKEQYDDLINQVNLKSVKIFDLNARLQEKVLVITALKDDLKKLKGKALVDNAVMKHTIDPEMLKIYVEPITPKLLNKKTAHSAYIKHTQEEATHSKLNANSELKCVKCNGCMLSDNHDLPTGRTFTIVGNACPLTRITTTTEVPLRKPTILDNEIPKPIVTLVYSRKPRKSKTNVPASKSKVLKYVSANKKEPSTIKFGNDHVAKILGYGDYHIGNVTISRVYYMEGLGHNLFSVGQFCDSNLKVAFCQHTCFICNLEGVDLLTGSRGNNLYTLSLGDMMASSPICLLSKASKTKSWLWHRRLSHLNFGAINHLARHGLVRGLPKLKFEKDHLCSACAMGKSKKKPHKPKFEDTNQEKLYLLHMDLCGPMRVKCLRSKDEAPDFIIKFLKMIQVRLKVTVRRIRTNNGTEFVNLTLREYYEKVGISHETFVARSPQQNSVVERRNRTLIEAARTMLIYAKAPLFLWAEAVATACYTQNHSIVRLRHGKTPYELLHDKLPDLSFFYVFGALCYSTNDNENLGKLQPKVDIGIFISYAPTKKAFQIYNRHTRRIMETIHVDFDELTVMASEHSSLGPALHEMTPATISSGLMPNPPRSTPVDNPAPEVVAPIAKVVAPEPAASTGSPSSTTVDQDAPSPSNSQTTPKTQSLVISNDVEEDNHDLDVAHMNNDPFFGIPIPENDSKASSSLDIIPTVVHTATPNSEHVTK
ncbi:retrovirus-related pol polyprotein from transposon TNT 1-94 [Tanacetum coccineum]